MWVVRVGHPVKLRAADPSHFFICRLYLIIRVFNDELHAAVILHRVCRRRLLIQVLPCDSHNLIPPKENFLLFPNCHWFSSFGSETVPKKKGGWPPPSHPGTDGCHPSFPALLAILLIQITHPEAPPGTSRLPPLHTCHRPHNTLSGHCIPQWPPACSSHTPAAALTPQGRTRPPRWAGSF